MLTRDVGREIRAIIATVCTYTTQLCLFMDKARPNDVTSSDLQRRLDWSRVGRMIVCIFAVLRLTYRSNSHELSVLRCFCGFI